MTRRYEVTKTETGWKLTLYEDDIEAGGGVGQPDDYEWLIDQGEEFIEQ